MSKQQLGAPRSNRYRMPEWMAEQLAAHCGGRVGFDGRGHVVHYGSQTFQSPEVALEVLESLPEFRPPVPA